MAKGKAVTKKVTPIGSLAVLSGLQEDLATVQEALPKAKTTDLGDGLALLKAFQKAVEAVWETARGEMLKRVKTDKKAFTEVGDKGTRELRGNFGTVAVQKRSSIVMRDGALDWLAKKHPAEYISATRRNVFVKHPAKLKDQVIALQREMESASDEGAIRMVDFDRFVKQVEALGDCFKDEKVLDTDAVERLIADKKLSVKEVADHLYTVETTPAVVVTLNARDTDT